jgi:hypothetical protein
MPIANVPEALLQTIVHQIALLLVGGAGGDINAARKAASEILFAYAPQTEAELRLAARIVGFSLQAIEALSQAAAPEMPLLRVLRLRTGAVSLSREAQKAERQLEKLRENRALGQPEPAPAAAEPESPRIEKTTALIDDNRKVAAYAKSHGLTWSQALKQRYRDQRLAERARKQQKRQDAAAARIPAMA